MSEETPQPAEYEVMIEKQELRKSGFHPPENHEYNNEYTPIPENVQHPTDMYDTSFPDYSEKKRPDWLQIIEVNKVPSKSEMDQGKK